MLQDIYNELKALYDSEDSSSISSGLVPFPASAGGITTVFVERSADGCWFTLDDNNERSYIPDTNGIRGALTDVKEVTTESMGYEPKQKLKFYISTDSGTYMIYCGKDTSFGKSLVKGLAAYTMSELKDIVVGVKPSDETVGKGAKVVFARVVRGDGSYNRTDNDTPVDVQLNGLYSKLGLKSPELSDDCEFPF